jgi:hypothetical protein
LNFEVICELSRESSGMLSIASKPPIAQGSLIRNENQNRPYTAMPKFKVGDWVQVQGDVLVSAFMREGRIVRVIPHPELPKGLDEYEVQFGFNRALLYETQLRAAPSAFEEH